MDNDQQHKPIGNFMDNPFMKAISSKELSTGNMAGGENPFFSLSKPIFVSSSTPAQLNMFGKDNSSDTISSIIGQNSAVHTFGFNAPSEVDVKNPFFTASNSIKSSTVLDEAKDEKVVDSMSEKPNPFLDKNVPKTKTSSATNPFLGKVPPDSNPFKVAQVPVVKKQSFQKKTTFGTSSAANNPFLSSTTASSMFTSTTNKGGIIGIKGRISPFPNAEKPIRTESNMFLKGLVPAKLGSKQERSSLDELKPTLVSLADNLKSVVCRDSEVKHDVLDKIDKAIRKGVKSNFHIKDGKRYRALKGTCLDMCPEKERYFRDDKHQISPYELTTIQDIVSSYDGNYPQLDHKKAVKEYSRSSADQEEPLPHQLRPASVLTYTMDYLVTNIMDVKFSIRCDWFDFLWNRTRAIRKEITQQNLSCLQTVSLIEKSARFHIFCSHYLCEHELHVFEPKMNLENLTKCLQTLKHLYEDKRKESDDIMPNEPEFRCYQILLNLNDGDMLREVMHFQKEVRESAPVKFALKVYSAVHDNNYVRFFKLLKSTSYLNACLLHPYFTQIRQSALTVMVRTFSQQIDVPFPLDNLQHILAFDDPEDVIDFCASYGLHSQDTNVFFNRSTFEKPDDPLPIKLSRVVGEKLVSPMSEIVNNGPVDYNMEIREPTNSFSSTGTYIGVYHLLDNDTFNESVIEEVVSNKKVVDVIEILSSPSSAGGDAVIQINETIDLSETTEHKEIQDEDNDQNVEDTEDEDRIQRNDPDYSFTEGNRDDAYSGDEENAIMFLREDYMAYVDEIVENNVTDVCKLVSVEVIEEAKDELTQSEVIKDQALAIMCIEQTRKAVAEVIFEEQKKLEIERKEMEEIYEKQSHVILDDVIDETVTTLIHSLCEDVCQDELRISNANVEADEMCNQRDVILKTTVDLEMKKIASDVISETCLDRKRSLEAIQMIMVRKTLNVMFRRWIKAYKQQQFIKTSLIDFPPLPPLISTKEAVRRLHPDGDISYSLPTFSEVVTKIVEPKVAEIEKEEISYIATDKTGFIDLNTKPLSAIIEDTMSSLFFKDFHEHCLHCERLLLPVADPTLIVKFYNDSLDAIKNKLSSIVGIDKAVTLLVSSLRLPTINNIDPFDWELCCSECEDFVSKVTDKRGSVLLNRIDNTLNRYLLQLAEDEEIIFPWSEILEACIFSKMSNMYLKTNSSNFSFDTLIALPSNNLSLYVVNPLKKYIKEKRSEQFALKNNVVYNEAMKQKKYNREFNLRRSLDGVDLELDRIEATFSRQTQQSSKQRSASVQELFNESAMFLANVDYVKHSCSFKEKSLSSHLEKNDTIKTRKSESPLQKGCKRTFEYSMVECLQGIEDYRLKLKTREEYWKRIVEQE